MLGGRGTPCTNRAQPSLTSVIGREPVFSRCCGRSRDKLILKRILDFRKYNIIPTLIARIIERGINSRDSNYSLS